MSFNGTEGNPILPHDAHECTKAYREANPHEVLAHFFGRDILLNILAQEGCMGIRLYRGLDKSAPMLVAVGADNEENDQLGTSLLLANDSITSPPRGGVSNYLNSDMPVKEVE